MAGPSIVFNLDAVPQGLPLFQRIAEAVAREIRRGRMAPGQKLPSSRRLASTLGVHRNTVLAAYEELERQGYLDTEPARGTFVASALPDRSPRASAPIDRVAPMRIQFSPAPPMMAFSGFAPGVLALVAGHPDLRQVPMTALSRAYRAALRSTVPVLEYGSGRGQPRLLAALSTFLRDTRGIVCDEHEIITTRGSQQALHLVARSLVRPGTVVVVERYGYRPAWEAFRLAGAEVVAVGVDAEGLVVADLQRLAQQREISFVYVTPHHQYPTTVTMSGARRMQLLQLAQEQRFCIVEDDYDHEFHFEGRPVLPLASTDPARVVVHIGTLSKVFAPGLRLGYAVAQPEIIDHMAAHRRFIDQQGDHATELAMAYLLEDGEIEAHIRRMHRLYSERRLVLHEALRHRLGAALAFDPPPGGLALWVRILCDVRPESWAEQALKRDLIIDPASRFRFDGRSAPFFRLGFSRHDPAELTEAVGRLVQSLRAATGGRQVPRK